MLIKERTPFPREHNVPTIIINPKMIKQAVNLLNLRFSHKTATIASTREIEEVNAAKKTSKKKIIPNTLPIPMLLKTSVNCINIKDPPLFDKTSSGLSEKANTAGIIINADTIAKSESHTAICAEEVVILTSFFI